MGSYFQIKGGAQLNGRVQVHGAKNAVLPLLALSIMTDEDVVIRDCPRISDVDTMLTILKNLGKCVRVDARTIRVCGQAHSVRIKDGLAGDMRSSMFMLGALLSRCKEVDMSLPGGCSIGARPMDIHFDGLRKLGADVYLDENGIHCRANDLVGADIVMKYASVGATENLLMCASLAKGHTTLINCAREPEIVALAHGLRNMGARISGEGSSVIQIDGVDKLGPLCIQPPTDRIVVGTLLCAVATCGGKVLIDGGDITTLRALVDVLRCKDCEIVGDEHHIEIKASGHPHACNITTAPYPLFPTDLQAQILAYSCFADGVSMIRETVFENRFSHATELKNIGMDISIQNKNIAKIVGCHSIEFGANRVREGDMYARDLRGGAGLMIAGLKIVGSTRVFNTEYIARGYEDIDGMFCSLGAHVRKKTFDKGGGASNFV